MEQFVLNASPRENLGTGAARAYRRAGLIPATVYGHGQPPSSLLVNEKELVGFLRHHGSLAMLKVEGQAEITGMGVIIKETQRDPVGRNILSVDFQWVSLTETVIVNVPLHLVGDAPGVKAEGGSLEQTLHEISISCLPGTIPDFIEADISALHTGQSLHVSNIVAPANIIILTPETEAIAVIAKGIRAEDLEVRGDEGLPTEEAATEEE